MCRNSKPPSGYQSASVPTRKAAASRFLSHYGADTALMNAFGAGFRLESLLVCWKRSRQPRSSTSAASGAHYIETRWCDEARYTNARPI
jgi:hypothetical protein